MSTSIDVITSGYADLTEESSSSNQRKKFMRATGSCCLVRSNQMVVLFDTMGPWERDILVERLAGLKIHVDDIEYLVCSHSHPDHVGNLNLFTSAKKHFVGTSIYTGDVYDLNCFEPTGSRKYKPSNGSDEIEVIDYEHYALNSHLSIESTQGHTMECISLIVKNCDNYGTVGLVGDLFENSTDINDDSIWLGAGSQNPDLQRANRSRIYNKVDFILPGHGELFKSSPETKL